MMTWYFCYYVGAKFSHAYSNPTEYLNMPTLESCSNIVVHTNSHRIHEIGLYLKMYGLSTAIIIETPDVNEATILRLLEQTVINESQFAPDKCPRLQLIVGANDLSSIDTLCLELDEARFNQQCSREDTETQVRKIQRMANHLTRLVDDLEEKASQAFKNNSISYANHCMSEIDRYTAEHKKITKTTTVLRKQLMKTMMPMITYMGPDSGFK